MQKGKLNMTESAEIGTILSQNKDEITKKEFAVNTALSILNSFKKTFDASPIKIGDLFLDFMQNISASPVLNKTDRYKKLAIAESEKAMAASGQTFLPLLDSVKKSAIESIEKLISIARATHGEFEKTGCSYSEFDTSGDKIEWKKGLREALIANNTLSIETKEQSVFWSNYLQAKNCIKLIEESLNKNYSLGKTPYSSKDVLKYTLYTDGLFCPPEILRFIQK